MSPSKIRRREFLKTLGAAGTVAAGGLFCKPGARSGGFDAKGLPTVTLGKTGAVVPRIGIGLGSRYCAVTDEDEAQRILHAALDHGFYYWDTAHSYRNKDIVSEERLGRVLEGRRKDVFLATKTGARSYDGIMSELEGSLKRLRTDRLDLFQLHLIQSMADVETIGLPGGAWDAMRKVKEQGTARFIGFTGHLDAKAMAEAARRHEFDTMLIALNHYHERVGDFEGGAIPAAAGREMGAMIIKAVRPRETVEGLAAADLIRYGLTLPKVHAAVIGTDSVEVVEKNAALLKGFEPLAPAEMERLAVKLEPFFAGAALPWMKTGYRDGEAG
jgi:aryl-alcohol dehydrogenase-like predicted oxidoreductase